MPLNKEQERLIKTLYSDKHYATNYFITGPAGTGKSFILKKISTWLFAERKLSLRHVAFVSPAGIAALNIGGRTIHSMFNIDPYFDYSTTDLYEPISKIDSRISAIRILIIDEISMVSKRLLAHVHHKCGGYDNGRPFGGKQLLVFGDFMQLPPVLDEQFRLDSGSGESGRFIWRGNKVSNGYAFDSELWQSCEFTIFPLTQIMRQNDCEFAACLSELRYGRLSATTVKTLLRHLRLKEYKHTAAQSNVNEILPTILHGTTAHVNEMNQVFFDKLGTPTYSVEGLFTWSALTNDADKDRGGDDDYKRRGRSLALADPKIENAFCESVGVPRSYKIRVGAQILYRVNTRQLDLVNGSRGVVEAITLDESGRALELVTKFTDGRKINIGFKQLTRTVYSPIAHTHVRLTFWTIPVCLAWAMTIHKAQSLTLDKVALNLSKGEIFLPHQAYVALSRARALKDVYLSAIDFSVFTTNTETCDFQIEQIDKIYTNARESLAGSNKHDATDLPLEYFDYHDLLSSWPLLEPFYLEQKGTRIIVDVDASVYGTYKLDTEFFCVVPRHTNETAPSNNRNEKIRRDCAHGLQQADARDYFDTLTSVVYNFDGVYSIEFHGRNTSGVRCVVIWLKNIRCITSAPISIICSGMWVKYFPVAKCAARLQFFEYNKNFK